MNRLQIPHQHVDARLDRRLAAIGPVPAADLGLIAAAPHRHLARAVRAHLLAALSCIDYVTIFDEDTPLELIRLLKPQILAKGGDYTLENVVGREIVESYGGRVELVRFVDGKSTTNIIENMNGTVRRVCRNVKRWRSASMAIVSRGMTHDGLGKYLSEVVEKAPGKTADISVLSDETGEWKLSDNGNVTVTATRRLAPLFCLRAGKMFEADAPILPH